MVLATRPPIWGCLRGLRGPSPWGRHQLDVHLADVGAPHCGGRDLGKATVGPGVFWGWGCELGPRGLDVSCQTPALREAEGEAGLLQG